MTRVRVEGFTISLDGYGAGPNQDIDNPLGVGGTELHQWLFPTRTLQRALFGKDGGATGVDDDSVTVIELELAGEIADHDPHVTHELGVTVGECCHGFDRTFGNH